MWSKFDGAVSEPSPHQQHRRSCFIPFPQRQAYRQLDCDRAECEEHPETAPTGGYQLSGARAIRSAGTDQVHHTGMAQRREEPHERPYLNDVPGQIRED